MLGLRAFTSATCLVYVIIVVSLVFAGLVLQVFCSCHYRRRRRAELG